MRRKEGDKSAEILTAAVRVFARDGFDKAQVSAIAAQAGVGTGSIYLYFGGKDDMLECLFSQLWENLAKRMENLTQPDPLFRLNDHLGLFFDALAENRDLAQVYLREHHRYLESKEPKGWTSYQKCLKLGHAAFAEIVASQPNGTAPDSTSLSLSQAFLFGGVRAALEFWLANDLDSSVVRSHMQTMAMASILASTEGLEP